MPRTLKIKTGAPEKPPFWEHELFKYNDETTCISPRGWYLEKGPNYHTNYRCTNPGKIKTDQGLLCVQHARVYARRGWINLGQVQDILAAEAQERARKAALRASCLRRRKCI